MWLTFQLGFQLDFPPLWLVIERCSVNRINWINTSVFIPQIIRRFLSDIYSYLCLYLVILFFFFFLVAAVVVAVVVVGLGFGYSRGCQGFFCAPPGFSRQWFRMLQSWFILNLFFLSFLKKTYPSLSFSLSQRREIIVLDGFPVSWRPPGLRDPSGSTGITNNVVVVVVAIAVWMVNDLRWAMLGGGLSR